ncbi:MAG: radical SAM family heme chaperone HemW [Opitutaceae bacterium]
MNPIRIEPTGPGIYVHVPFCAHACDFCAFYQVEPRKSDIERYLDTIAREFALAGGALKFDTAFWGGGTPGLLSARDLERLGRLQVDVFGPPMSEWTIELAPGSVREEKLRVLKDLGVTRVSLGVQSLDEKTLEALGRRHSVAQIEKAWAAIEKAGFPSRNLDLIFATPGQSLAGWMADLDAAIAMRPDHISTYCLTFEEDTAMFVRLSEGRVSLDVEREREFYEATWSHLGASGFFQYEISNFARPGHACLHNINTWRMGEWWGFGPSAASQAGGSRGSNASDLELWRADVAQGKRAQLEGSVLTPARLAEDAIIFGLRMNAGIDLAGLRARFAAAAVDVFQTQLDELVAQGLAQRSGKAGIVLSDAGRIVADAIGAEFVGAADEARA